MLFFLIALLVLGAVRVDALPRFHSVNRQFHNGTMCPAVTKNGVACPTLCVTDPMTDCPAAIGPHSCATPKVLCPDGSCQASCAGITNVCECPSQPGVQMHACRSGFQVNVTHWDPANADTQTYAACAAALNASGYSTWPNEQTSHTRPSAVWNVCPAPAGMIFPAQAPFMITCFGVYISFFVTLALWCGYKTFREKNIPSIEQYDDKMNDKKDTPVHLSMEKPFKGYRNDIFGNVMVVFLVAVSSAWILFLLFLSLDYYGYVNRVPYSLTYGSYDLSSKAFCVIWFLSTAWYLAMNLMRSRLRNYFRIRHPLHKADYVQIEKQQQLVHMLGGSTRSRWFNLMHRGEVFVRETLALDHLVATVRVKRSTLGHSYIEFQSTRYVLDETTNTFQQAAVDLPTKPSLILGLSDGLDAALASHRLELLGPNQIVVHVPHFAQAMWEEMTSFFYIYQIQILWCYFYLAYWPIGVSDTLVILLAAIVKVAVRLRSAFRIKSMAEHVDTCNVLRDGQWAQHSTADLVPGDVYEVVSHQVVPVDAVILGGDIVVDESSLTGEPLPIRKVPLRNDGQEYDRWMGGKISSLFSGTTVKQATRGSTALVLATRTNTDKGTLVQKILFPQPVSFIFHEQLKLVFCILICWALFLLGIGSWWLGGTGMTAWFYGTICAAQVMNPLLPAILVVGQSAAAGRLKKKKIYCVDFPRILMAGKVQIFCFDKTGTLTKEGLEFSGVYPVENQDAIKIGAIKASYKELDMAQENDRILRMGMAACHSVTALEGEYIGNPVDIVMFQATGATISSLPDEQDEITLPPHLPDNGQCSQLEVIQRFEFQHARSSMSVAVRDKGTQRVHIFCKGSFERMADITVPDSMPSNFDVMTTQLAREGCYVLGMAHCDLGTQVDDDTVRGWSRDKLESQLKMIGLIVFRNQLKEDTADSIAALKRGDVRPVMITGDTTLTGVHVAQACGMVPGDTPIVLGDVAHGALIWTDVDTQQSVEEGTLQDTELALTGKAFRLLVAQGTIRDYILRTRIFARMTPVDKMTCVEIFMEYGITAMCGDGGNDCGALRSAHVGIAMSDAEASVVSPFSTPNRSVRSCVDLLIEGRAALATSFASYKYLIMYGETMATVKFCTFYYTMSFSQWNFILVDAFITVFCAFAVTRAGAAKKLSSHRPTARILGPEVLLSVLGQLFINAWFLIGAYIWLYTRDDFFRCHEWDARAADASKWWLLGDSFEADVLTFVSLFQFVNSALIFSYGYIFRQAWYRNYLLLSVWMMFVSIVSYWELADPNPFGCLVRLNCGNPDVLETLGYPRPSFHIDPYNNPLGHNVLPRTFRYQLWAYSIGNMVATHLWELVVILGPVRTWLRSRRPLPRLRINL